MSKKRKADGSLLPIQRKRSPSAISATPLSAFAAARAAKGHDGELTKVDKLDDNNEDLEEYELQASIRGLKDSGMSKSSKMLFSPGDVAQGKPTKRAGGGSNLQAKVPSEPTEFLNQRPETLVGQDSAGPTQEANESERGTGSSDRYESEDENESGEGELKGDEDESAESRESEKRC